MLVKKKMIFIRSRKIKNYNTTFNRVNRRDGVLLFGANPCKVCKRSYFTCMDRVTCESIYRKFNQSWVYAV